MEISREYMQNFKVHDFSQKWKNVDQIANVVGKEIPMLDLY
jgi:hypothetical protein